MNRAHGLFGAAALVVSIWSAAPAGPSETTSELEVSPDGQQWAATYPQPLFDDDTGLVPGAAATGEVYVRNTTGDDASLWLSVTDVEVEGERTGGEHHRLDVSLHDGGRTVATASSDLATLSRAPRIDVRDSLGGGEVRRLAVALRLAEAAPNGTQASVVAFDLVIHLRDESVTIPVEPEPEPDVGPPDSEGPLPSTGGGWLVLIAVVAAMLTAAGFCLRAVRR